MRLLTELPPMTSIQRELHWVHFLESSVRQNHLKLCQGVSSRIHLILQKSPLHAANWPLKGPVQKFVSLKMLPTTCRLFIAVRHTSRSIGNAVAFRKIEALMPIPPQPTFKIHFYQFKNFRNILYLLTIVIGPKGKLSGCGSLMGRIRSLRGKGLNKSI